MLEVEIKVKIDIADIEEKLELLGYVKGTTVYEYDTYYNGCHMNLKAEDKALRVRLHKDVDSGEIKYILNYKGPKIDNITMTREETQFQVPSKEQAEIVLRGLGFLPAGNVEKTRIHYHKDDVTCCLDKVTGLGDFLEVEIMAEEDNYEAAVSKIRELLADLELNMADTIRQSYLCLLEER